MKLRPLGSNLLIRRADAEERSPGGLYIPEKAQNKPQRGTVVAAGPGYVSESGTFIETTVRVGDTVLFGAPYGVEVVFEGETLVMLGEDGVLAVVEP